MDEEAAYLKPGALHLGRLISSLWHFIWVWVWRGGCSLHASGRVFSEVQLAGVAVTAEAHGAGIGSDE